MTVFSTISRSVVVVGGLGLAFALSACAHASQDELDERLAQLSEEVRQADQANADRIDQVDQRVDAVENRMSSLERDLQALQDEFNTTVQRLESALRFSTPVHFAFDAAEIRTQDRPFLDRFASVVQQHYSDATITVEGFTDPVGSEAYNRRLGQRRADAVRQYLVENGGLTADRVRAVSYGEDASRLIADDEQGPGESGVENRRVTLVVDYVPRQGARSPSGTSGGAGSGR